MCSGSLFWILAPFVTRAPVIVYRFRIWSGYEEHIAPPLWQPWSHLGAVCTHCMYIPQDVPPRLVDWGETTLGWPCLRPMVVRTSNGYHSVLDRVTIACQRPFTKQHRDQQSSESSELLKIQVDPKLQWGHPDRSRVPQVPEALRLFGDSQRAERAKLHPAVHLAIFLRVLD
ncbi:hypothetical protein B0J11DRAFT_538071 [Dendryphion nanum]|uniref:Secreted protein n=1 Tax=Dendryphion nanum TaxID=256645 RepID=A0A9P9DCU4_9PLEO|nr:hypothetical protein B0J11DRAFT_538071 [Dendryphion nanum]